MDRTDVFCSESLFSHSVTPVLLDTWGLMTNSNWILPSEDLHSRLRLWTAVGVQWVRIHLPMQGTWVRSLVREDLTCHGPQLLSLSSRAGEPQPLKPECRESVRQEKPLQGEARVLQLDSSPCSPQLEKASAQQQRPRTAKN